MVKVVETTGPEPEEAAEEAVSQEEDEEIKTKEEPKEDQDTPPIHQSRAVIAIMFTELQLGTAWPP